MANETFQSALNSANALYKDLFTKIKRQRNAIDLENDEKVLAIIEEKDRSIEALGEMDKKIRSLLDPLDSLAREALLNESQSLLEENEQLLKSIIELEEHCTQTLFKKRHDVFQRMKGVQQGKSMLQGYSRTLPGKRPRISKNI